MPVAIGDGSSRGDRGKADLARRGRCESRPIDRRRSVGRGLRRRARRRRRRGPGGAAGRRLGPRHPRLVAARPGRPGGPEGPSPRGRDHARALPHGARRGQRPGARPRRRRRRLPVQAVRLRGAAGPRPRPDPSRATGRGHDALLSRRARGPGGAEGRAGRPSAGPDGQGAGPARLLPPPSRRGPVADADLRARLGRGIRLRLQHAGRPRQGAAPRPGGAGPAADPDGPGPGLPARRSAPSAAEEAP